tara:strand:+ start:10587 stop:12083 length:1497 start_codon:yes stop_codon:yes gene_type:complete
MKKKLSYRDKLLELAYIYNVKEIQEYTKRRKNLTIGQIELILKKNKITIPKEFKTNFFKENFSKPISKLKSNIIDYKEEKIKDKNRFLRRIENYKYDTSRRVNHGFNNLWKGAGNAGINFLNIFPKLGTTVFSFFGNLFTDVFNSIYNQQIDQKSARNVIIGFFLVVGVTTTIIVGYNTYKSFDFSEKKIETTKPKIKIEKEVKKPEVKKKEAKKPEIQTKKPNIAVKKDKKVSKSILPDLNLKTETVLNLFEDVNYDLNKVRKDKKVKPIYFTQFPRDLDELQSVKLKKETFIKIVLPLIVAENEKILEDRAKLKKIVSKKMTTDSEKQWLRQKLLEYKVKNGKVDDLTKKMDIIPTSLALAQAAKESGWGTSRFALEGNAMFGQWTWTGNGIEPLFKDKSKSHKILKFPILRASVKSYINNLNTHKSYRKLREKRFVLRNKNRRIEGLKLTETLDNYAETGKEYTKIIAQIIKENRLTDFEPVTLTKSKKVLEINS